MLDCPKDDALCQSSSAFESIANSLSRLFTGDWSRSLEDGLTLSVVIGFLVFSWYFALYTLKMSLSWERARERRSEQTPHRYLLSVVLRSRDNDGNEQPIPNNENEGQPSNAGDAAQGPREEEDASAPADFRAAGDGWENDEDIDYIVDEDLLAPGGFSDEDSDDDRVVLRQIIMAADDNSEIMISTPNDERQIAEVIEANYSGEGSVSSEIRNIAQDTLQEENINRVNETDSQAEAVSNTGNAAPESANNFVNAREKISTD